MHGIFWVLLCVIPLIQCDSVSTEDKGVVTEDKGIQLNNDTVTIAGKVDEAIENQSEIINHAEALKLVAGVDLEPIDVGEKKTRKQRQTTYRRPKLSPGKCKLCLNKSAKYGNCAKCKV